MLNVRGWLLVFIVSIFVCSHTAAALSSPWQNADVGIVGLAGSTLTADGAFTVTGSGADIWGTSDAFQYVYQPLNGDGEIIAHVGSEQNPDAWSKAGVMFRETLDASSSHALIAVTPSNGISFQWRSGTGANCGNASTGGIVAPAWVRLVRAGDIITAFRSSDGISWTQVGAPITVAMTQSIFVGMAVTSHNNSQLCTATFDNVRLIVHPTSDGDGLSGTYFDNVDLTGTTVNRVDPSINFLWGNGSPSLLIDPDTFSARWLGRVQPYYSEPFTFYTNSDDGVRLWVNHQLLIDNWTNHAPTENSATIQLTAGSTYDIRLEFYENTGGATMQLSWSSPSTPKQIVPQSQLFSTGSDMQIGTGDGLHGDYFNSIDLSTKVALSRVDSTVDFNWNGTQPDPTVNASGFSVRWAGQLQAQYSDSYTISVKADDGVRLWFNGQLQIDEWVNEAASEYNFTAVLVAGTKYDIMIEYYQNTGVSAAQLFWSSPMTPKAIIPQSQLYSTGNAAGTGTGTGLFASYFNTINLSGGLAPAFNTPTLTRVDGPINFNWGTGSPDPTINPDNFSVRWIGQIEPQFSETHTFFLNCDDGARLWINNKLVIDAWTDHAPTEFSGSIDLRAGEKVGIKLEYYEHTGGAVIHLAWSSPSRPKTTVPQSQLYYDTGLAVTLPTFSVTSPAFIEGIAWSPNGNPVAVTASGTSGPFFSDNNWFANVPLNSDGTGTPTVVSQTGTGSTKSGSILWWPLDLAGSDASDHNIVIRKGDSLLLTANGPGETLTIDVDGDGVVDVAGTPGQTFPTAYNSAGTFLVVATIDGEPTGTLVVTVMDADIHKAIADELSFTREKNVVVTPAVDAANVIFTAGDLLSMQVAVKGAFSNADGDGTTLYITTLKRGQPKLLTRLGSDVGPIMSCKDVDEFTLDIPALKTAIVDVSTNIGGTTLTMRPYIPDIRFEIDLFAHTSTFAGGAKTLSVNTSDLNLSTGEPLFKQSFDPVSNEIVGVYYVELQVPPGETKYCFRPTANQSSSQEKVVSSSPNVNGDVCLASVDKIVICQNEHNWKQLPITLTGGPDNVSVAIIQPYAAFAEGDNGSSIGDALSGGLACPGAYNPWVIGISPGVCDVYINGVIFEKRIYVINLTVSPSDASVCTGEDVTFTASGEPEGGSYTWTAVGGDPSYGDSETLTTKFSTEGTHEVDVTYYFEGGSCSQTVYVTVGSPKCEVSLGNVAGCPGERVLAPLTITNTGTCSGTFSWFGYSLGGDVTLTVETAVGTVTLGPGESTNVNIAINITDSSNFGSSSIRVDVGTTGNAASCTAGASVTVPKPECFLSVGAIDACPGDTVPVSFSLTNAGQCRATFTWMAVARAGGVANIVINNPIGTATLSPGESMTTPFSVTIPLVGNASKYGTTTIDVVVMSMGTVTCTGNGSVTIPEPKCKIVLGSVTICPDEDDTLPGVLQNTGKCDTEYNWDIHQVGGSPSLIISNNMGTVTLAPGESFDIPVLVFVSETSDFGAASIQIDIRSSDGTLRCSSTGTINVPQPDCFAKVGNASTCPGGSAPIMWNITNAGQCRTTYVLTMNDADEAGLIFLSQPGSVTLSPGETAFGYVDVVNDGGGIGTYPIRMDVKLPNGKLVCSAEGYLGTIVVNLYRIDSTIKGNDPWGQYLTILTDWPDNGQGPRSARYLFSTTDYVGIEVNGSFPDPKLNAHVASESDPIGFDVVLDINGSTWMNTGAGENLQFSESTSSNIFGHQLHITNEELFTVSIQGCDTTVMVARAKFASVAIHQFNGDNTVISQQATLGQTNTHLWNSGSMDFNIPNDVDVDSNAMATFIRNAGAGDPNKGQASYLFIASHGASDGMLGGYATNGAYRQIFDPSSLGSTNWNRDVKWALLDSCEQLNDNGGGKSRWLAPFNGAPYRMHGLLGSYFDVAGDLSGSITGFFSRANGGASIVGSFINAWAFDNPKPQPWAVEYYGINHDDTLKEMTQHAPSGSFIVYTTFAGVTGIPPGQRDDLPNRPKPKESIDNGNCDVYIDLPSGPINKVQSKLSAAAGSIKALSIPGMTLRNGESEQIEYTRADPLPSKSSLSEDMAKDKVFNFITQYFPKIAGIMSLKSIGPIRSQTIVAGKPGDTWTAGYVLDYGFSYDGVPAWMEHVRIRISGDAITSVSIRYHELVKEVAEEKQVLDLRKNISKFIGSAKDLVGIVGKYDLDEADLVYVSRQQISHDLTNSGEFILAWHIHVKYTTKDGTANWKHFFVDAISGELINKGSK